MTIGIISISSIFVPWFFGTEYTNSIYILYILSWLYIFMGINSLTGTQYLVSTNQQNKHTKYLIIGGLFNIVLNIILIPRLQARGAAIASVVGEAVVSILEIYYLNKTKQYKARKILKETKTYIISGIFMGIVLFIVKRTLNNNIRLMLTMVVIGSIVYVMSLILLKDELVLEEIKKIKKKLSLGRNV